MALNINLDLDLSAKLVSEKVYRDMISSLLYLTANRSDIIFNVHFCVRFQSAPEESHLTVVERIFIYLVDTKDIGLWYAKDGDFNLICYLDVDYSRYKVEKKSTLGYYQFLGHSLVSWCLNK